MIYSLLFDMPDFKPLKSKVVTILNHALTYLNPFMHLPFGDTRSKQRNAAIILSTAMIFITGGGEKTTQNSLHLNYYLCMILDA